MALTVTVRQVFDLDNYSKVKGYDLDSYIKVLVNGFDLDHYSHSVTLDRFRKLHLISGVS